MTIQEKADLILDEARKQAPQAKSWIDFSNTFFAQDTGLVARTFPRMQDRQEFYDLPQYEEVNKILADLMDRLGIADAGTRQKAGTPV